MRSHEQRISDTTTELTKLLTEWGAPEADTKAHQIVRLLLESGWRTTRADLERPPANHGTPADATTWADRIRADLRAEVRGETA